MTVNLPFLMWRHRGGRRLSMSQDENHTRHQIYQGLELDLPASKTIRNKCLFLSRPPSLWYFIFSSPDSQDDVTVSSFLTSWFLLMHRSFLHLLPNWPFFFLNVNLFLLIGGTIYNIVLPFLNLQSMSCKLLVLLYSKNMFTIHTFWNRKWRHGAM